MSSLQRWKGSGSRAWALDRGEREMGKRSSRSVMVRGVQRSESKGSWDMAADRLFVKSVG